MSKMAFSCTYMSLWYGGHCWILAKQTPGLYFLLTNPILVQRCGSILREGESPPLVPGDNSWVFSVGISIPFCCDWFKEVMWHSCGHWGTKEKTEVRWGTSRKDLPSSQKERCMGEALGSSVLPAFWLCCLRLWCSELRQLFCYHEEHIWYAKHANRKTKGAWNLSDFTEQMD